MTEPAVTAAYEAHLKSITELPCEQKGRPMPPICPICGATAEDQGCRVDNPHKAVLALLDDRDRLQRIVDGLHAILAGSGR